MILREKGVPLSARESIVNNIIIITIIVNLVNTITTSSPARHHHHQHHHQQQHHAITLTIPIIISSIRAQEENLSARGSGISNCVSPTNTFHPPPAHAASTWGRRGAKLCIPRPKVFSSCMETPTGSNWIQLRLCESLVDPILPFSGSNFLAWKPRGSNSFAGINL